jgi:predicted regulator of Ras-like GTPase activity (Roadblock/LC7/MglB family)
MTEDKLLAEMQMLRDRIAGITGTAVASRDGLIIREDTGGVDPDNLAALTSAALSLAQRLAREAGQGTLREAITRSSGGYVAIYAVGASAALVLLGDEGLDITRLHRESRSVVDNLEKLLALGQRAAANRGVEDLRGVRDRDVLATLGQGGGDLK